MSTAINEKLKEFILCGNYLVKYPDCNSTQNLFGGKLLSWIDESAAIFAAQYMKQNNIVTAHFGALDFKVRTEIGKVVNVYVKVIKEGTSSLRVKVIATKNSMGEAKKDIIAENEIVFVSVNPSGFAVIWNDK